jgi:hypothetical protein
MSVPSHAASHAQPLEESAAVSGAAAEPLSLDREALLARFAGDADFFDEVAGVFLEDWPRMVDALCAASEEHDFAALRTAAHSVKGAVSHFTDGAPYRAIALVEQLAATERSEAFDEAQRAIAVLRAFVAAVAAARPAAPASPQSPRPSV